MYPYLDNSVLTAGELISQQKSPMCCYTCYRLKSALFFMHVAEVETVKRVCWRNAQARRRNQTSNRRVICPLHSIYANRIWRQFKS
jgi:hypothetical protein